VEEALTPENQEIGRALTVHDLLLLIRKNSISHQATISIRGGIGGRPIVIYADEHSIILD